MAAVNYAHAYQQALEQAWPYALYFGDLFNTPNNQKYRWVNARTIEIPTLETTGRVDSNRDTIATASRNYNNKWTPLTLQNGLHWYIHKISTKQIWLLQLVTSLKYSTKNKNFLKWMYIVFQKSTLNINN